MRKKFTSILNSGRYCEVSNSVMSQQLQYHNTVLQQLIANYTKHEPNLTILLLTKFVMMTVNGYIDVLTHTRPTGALELSVNNNYYQQA